MCAQHHKLVGLLPAFDLRYYVVRSKRPANAVGNRIAHPHLLASLQQTGNALAILTRQQHLRIIVDPVIEAANMPVEQILLAGRDEGHRCRSGSLCRLQQRAQFQVLCKQVIPVLHHVGMHQGNCAFQVGGFLEVFVRALAHVYHREALNWRVRGRSPRQRDSARVKLHRADNIYLCAPFIP